jgi:ATP-dependent helicase HrpB
MLGAPDLAGIGAIVLDEFHERHLYSDVSLAMARRMQETLRPDLLLIVMSATLEGTPLEKELAPCALLRTAGRAYPIRLEYLPRKPAPRAMMWDVAAEEAARVCREHPTGHVLIFMPGAYEIQRTLRALQTRPEARGCALLPLYGDLPAREQDAAVAPADRRKIIVATNVAETSLTIDGVQWVIDSGLARLPRFDPRRGINTLYIEKICRASADQRAGRAGRTAPGLCLRLWTAQEHMERPQRELPEIRRLDLAEIVLLLKACGIQASASLCWLEPPEPRMVARAERLLADLGALDATTGRITPEGRRMLAFPIHPRYARLMLAAHKRGCLRTAALIAALTQERNLLLARQGSAVEERRERRFGEEEQSDFFRLIRAWQAAERCDYNVRECEALGLHALTARQVRRNLDHFLAIAAAEGLQAEAEWNLTEDVQRCVLAGFADQVARRLDGGTLRCELVHGRKGELAPTSVVRRSPFFVAAEVQEIEKSGGQELKVRLDLATAIRPEWLHELFPGDIRRETRTFLDPHSRRVTAVDVVLFHDLLLEQRAGSNPDRDIAARLLAEEVAAERNRLKNWDHEVEQWILRVNFLQQWCPELDLPRIEAAERRALLVRICQGALSLKEVRERPVMPIVRAWLSAAQQAAVDKHAPPRVTLPTGRTVKVVYPAKGPPAIAARIEDLYGVERLSAVALKRVPVVIQVLAPNFRPVQISQDLSRFWREDYPRLKRELQRKYPKHPWR